MDRLNDPPIVNTATPDHPERELHRYVAHVSGCPDFTSFPVMAYDDQEAVKNAAYAVTRYQDMSPSYRAMKLESVKPDPLPKG